MRTEEMKKAVVAALEEESRTHSLAGLVAAMGLRAGNRMEDAQVDEVVRWIAAYAYMAPVMIEKADEAARKAGVSAQIQPLLDESERYWFEAQDFLPDQLGLVGLIDDAYVALSLLQAASERHLSKAGAPLLPVDLTQANAFARQLIGEPIASQLDATLASAKGSPTFLGMLQQLMSMGAGALPFASGPTQIRDPIWGNASVEEIANVRLGAMGIF